MPFTLGTFHFVLLTPTAKIMDCRVGSLIVPTHDGQMGILRNHMPMLTKLGLGIMQVSDIVYEKGRPGGDCFFLIDGGFVRISENNVTILAYDVETFEGMETSDIDKIIAQSQKLLAGDAYSQQDRRHDIEKASVLIRLAKYSGYLK